MEYKNIGDQAKLNKTPQSSPSSDPSSGKFANVGDAASLNRTPVSSPSSDPSSGKFANVGDSVSLNRTPVKGWAMGGDMPMSERAVKQSQKEPNG